MAKAFFLQLGNFKNAVIFLPHHFSSWKTMIKCSTEIVWQDFSTNPRFISGEGHLASAAEVQSMEGWWRSKCWSLELISIPEGFQIPELQIVDADLTIPIESYWYLLSKLKHLCGGKRWTIPPFLATNLLRWHLCRLRNWNLTLPARILWRSWCWGTNSRSWT